MRFDLPYRRWFGTAAFKFDSNRWNTVGVGWSWEEEGITTARAAIYPSN